MFGVGVMVGARRIEDGLRRVATQEAEYREILIRELEYCAAGAWGLFGQNEHLAQIGRSADVQALLDLGKEIDAERARLGEGRFELHGRLLAQRGRQGEHQAGEPRLARRWLDELVSEDGEHPARP